PLTTELENFESIEFDAKSSSDLEYLVNNSLADDIRPAYIDGALNLCRFALVGYSGSESTGLLALNEQPPYEFSLQNLAIESGHHYTKLLNLQDDGYREDLYILGFVSKSN